VNENNFTQEQLYALIQYASKKLGTTPQGLAKTVEEGGVSGLMGSLSPENAKKLNELVGDRSQAEALLNSPKVQQMLAQILNK